MAKRDRAQLKFSEDQVKAANWLEEIAKSEKRLNVFHTDGDQVQDRYRLENNRGITNYRDKYNMLYSSTETIKPSLYTKTPKTEAVQRHKDRSSLKVVGATLLIEAVTQYCIEDIDFDTVAQNAIEDFLLPGLGQAWVRYDPVIGGEGESETVVSESIAVDYVFWKDFGYGVARTWPEVPWVSRKVYFDKQRATTRFGAEKANKLSYTFEVKDDGNGNMEARGNGGQQSVIYEIWHKATRKVFWVSKDYPDGFLDEQNDPLKLKDFFPCPQPLRAVHTTRTFTPKSFYSQYKAQAEAVDDITARIRILTDALKVVGVYDASQTELARVLAGNVNKMVPVENWASFQGQNGIKGSVDWVPISEVATVLTELYRQREIAKAEIYEITGFSDIVRGISKASETLGAQQIKNEWAGGRLRAMQTKVQNWIRDIVRIIAEIASEQFDEATLAIYAGFEPPEITPEEQAAIAQYGQMALTDPAAASQPPPQTGQQLAIEQFKTVVKVLRDEKQRCALIGIETDSTIQPDEAAERKDRMEFLGQIGAFLQQAGPMALQYPDMRGLLGSIMMFAVHTFRSSRGIEKEFEEFTKALQGQPAMPPPGAEGKEGGADPAAAEAQVKSEEIKAQAEQAKAQQANEIKKYEIDAKTQIERERMAMDSEYKARELDLKERELELRERELSFKAQAEETKVQLQAEAQQHSQSMDVDSSLREEQHHRDELSERQQDREMAENQGSEEA